jgi:hypothetical protein
MSKIDDFYSGGNRSKMDDFYGVKSREDRATITARRRRDSVLGKIHREAVRNKDLNTIANLEKRMGFTYYGLENRDDKMDRYREEGHQRRFDGDTVVGKGSRPDNRLPVIPGESLDDAMNRAADAYVPAKRDADGFVQTFGRSEAAVGGDNPPSSRPSLAEQEKMMREKVFGDQKKDLPWDNLGQQRKDYVDTIRGVLEERDGGMTPALRSSAVKKGKQLGLNDDQINAALSGFAGDELSPSSIAGRKVKKEAKPEEGFDDLIERNVTDPDTKKFLESLPPETREEAMRDLAERRQKSADESQKRRDMELLPGSEMSSLNLPKPYVDSTSEARRASEEALRKSDDAARRASEMSESYEKAVKDQAENKGKNDDSIYMRSISRQKADAAANAPKDPPPSSLIHGLAKDALKSYGGYAQWMASNYQGIAKSVISGGTKSTMTDQQRWTRDAIEARKNFESLPPLSSNASFYEKAKRDERRKQILELERRAGITNDVKETAKKFETSAIDVSKTFDTIDKLDKINLI